MNLDNSLPEGIIETFDPELKRAYQVNDEISESLKDYKKIGLRQGFLKVSGDRVFYTIQGEGVTMGYPAVFLRLKLCNLRCIWCDAWYTWNPKAKEFWQEGEDWNIFFTAQKIKQAWDCQDNKIQKRLVITGGEPLLQKQEIDKLIDELQGWKIEIETNGTIEPTLKQLKSCQFNCSPKLANSLNVKEVRIRPKVLKLLNTLNNAWFKFVVMSKEDVEEIERDFIKPYELDPNKVILMPQGVKEEEIQANMKNVVEIAKKKRYRLLGRLHVAIWGAKRKV
jgi:organic radical activating enzyme